MSGFSNSLGYLIFTACHPNPIFQFIHSATSQKSHDLSHH